MTMARRVVTIDGMRIRSLQMRTLSCQGIDEKLHATVQHVCGMLESKSATLQRTLSVIPNFAPTDASRLESSNLIPQEW